MVKRPAVRSAAGPIKVPRCDAPISIGAPSNAIRRDGSDLMVSTTAIPLKDRLPACREGINFLDWLLKIANVFELCDCQFHPFTPNAKAFS
jgi:hypothetical protein